ncbi:MAG: enoyl-CoA hydratase-related protein [bacterium]
MPVHVSREDHICTVTLDRPEARNSFDYRLLADLSAALEGLGEDEAARVIVFTGAGGKAFCAGGDIAQMQRITSEEGHLWGRMGHEVFKRVRELPQPTIAAVRGLAVGAGCELAACCDLRVASSDAKFGHPEVSLGIMPGWGGTQLLPRLIGVGRAKELIFSGRLMGAEEALACGLVNRVVAPEELEAEVRRLAEAIIRQGPLGVRRAKLAVNRGLDAGLDAGCELEASFFGLCFGPEQQEGMTAFLEKRPAKF